VAGMQVTTRSAIAGSAFRRGMKESASKSETVDYDKHKQDSLAKQKAGKGHWKPELASDSEEAVKSDRSTGDATPEAMKRLQERTKKIAEETLGAGTSLRDAM